MPNIATDDLHSRFIQVEQAVKRLKDGADDVRATLPDTKYHFLWPSILLVKLISTFSLFLEVEACCERSQDIVDRITDAAATLESLY
jgi:autophagy-related protein 11